MTGMDEAGILAPYVGMAAGVAAGVGAIVWFAAAAVWRRLRPLAAGVAIAVLTSRWLLSIVGTRKVRGVGPGRLWHNFTHRDPWRHRRCRYCGIGRGLVRPQDYAAAGHQ